MSKNAARTMKSAKPAPRTSDPSELSLPVITQAEAKQRLVERATERYTEAQAERDRRIAEFEREVGPCSEIDRSLVDELSRLQFRFSAIAARQSMSANAYGEPKGSKFAKQIGEMLGEISTHLAQQRVLSIFTRVNEHDYLGYQGSGNVGKLGYDPTVLEGVRVAETPNAPKNVTPSPDAGGETVCLHDDIERCEDDPTKGQCLDCGAEFAYPDDDSATAAEPVAAVA